MKISKTLLLADLMSRTEQNIIAVQDFYNYDFNQLNQKQSLDSWSVLECIEHLNLYGDYYLPKIEQALLQNPVSTNDLLFNSGLLGNYFAQMMLPKEDGSIQKIQSPKDKNPNASVLSSSSIDRFLKQQKLMLQLLEAAQNKNLGRIKISISISQWIRLKLGDTLRFVIYHNQRHILQAQRVLAAHQG